MKDIFMIKSIHKNEKIDKFSYDTNIVEAIRKKMYHLLLEPEFKKLKSFIYDILNSFRFKNEHRRIILYPVLEMIFRYITTSKKVEKYPIIDLDDVCETTFDSSLCNMEKINLKEYEILESKNSYLSYSLKKMYKDDNYVGYNVILAPHINELNSILKELKSNLEKLDTNIRMKLIVDNKKYSKIKEILIEDLIRNSFTKYQILVEYKKPISDLNRYEVNKKNEILLFEEDLLDKNKVYSLYENEKKKYYRILNHFGEVNQLRNEEKKSTINSCELNPIGIKLKYKRKFKKLKLKLMNKKIVNKDKYLSFDELERLKDLLKDKNLKGIRLNKIGKKLKYRKINSKKYLFKE